MIYTYECNECHNRQEVWHKLNESNTESCEKCQAKPEQMKRIMSMTAGPHISWSSWRIPDASK